MLTPLMSQQAGMFISGFESKDLNVLAELAQSGKVRPVIDRRYPLEQAAEAIRYVEEGHAQAKVVVTLP